MDRRDFLKTAGVGAAALAAGTGRARAAQDGPNIIVIMADDLGYGDLGCYGSEAIATPNLDRLAEDGVRLTNFFSSAPVCSPSRGGLLTGRYPARIPINGVYFPSRFPATPALHAFYRLGPGMNTREIILAQLLGDAGYATCCIGKWHLGDLKKYRPHHRGFDHYFGVLYSNDMIPLDLYRNDEIVEKAPANQDYFTQKYTEEALTWIRENQDRPFFLYLPHTFPHRPLHASPDFRGRSQGGLYGDCVEEIDWSTGRIMDLLEELNLADNTFVFFTSDNGPWFQGSAGGRRGRKNEIFDGGMNVPAIARFPGVIPRGTVSEQMSMNFDLFATAAALAGAPLPDDRPIDGLDIMPMLAGRAETPHDALFFYKSDNLYAVRTPRWKYHRRHPAWNAGYAPMEVGPMLFDLQTDPDESYDVSGLHPEVAAELEQMMTEWERRLVKGVPR